MCISLLYGMGVLFAHCNGFKRWKTAQVLCPISLDKDSGSYCLWFKRDDINQLPTLLDFLLLYNVHKQFYVILV